MTTKLIIKNAASSNGDVHVDIKCGVSAFPRQTLVPGGECENWITTSHELKITETWPTNNPAGELKLRAEQADELIAKETAIQDRMWGDANERADAMNGQLLGAACAQAVAIYEATHFVPTATFPRAKAFEYAKNLHYPRDWDGFRDYGSDIANLVVAAAYLRNEIKRRLLKGESTFRAPRTEPYETATPNVSSADAADTL